MLKKKLPERSIKNAFKFTTKCLSTREELEMFSRVNKINFMMPAQHKWILYHEKVKRAKIFMPPTD